MSLTATVENGRLAMHNLISPLPECKPADQSGPENGDIAEIPVGLDPERHRIILKHWFGWRPVGAVVADVVQDLAFRREAIPVHTTRRLLRDAIERHLNLKEVAVMEAAEESERDWLVEIAEAMDARE